MAKYNQDGGGGAGTATATPSTPAAPSAPEQAPQGGAPEQSVPAPKAEPGDVEVLESAKAKLKANPKYRLDDREAQAFRNVQKGQPKPGAKPEATEAKPSEAPAKSPEIPPHIKASMDRLKLEKAEDLPTSIEKMQKEIDRLNGERGNLGPLQERLQTASRTSEIQHAIIRDLAAGKPNALEWVKQNAQALGIDPASLQKPAAPAPEAKPGEWTPDQALDVETARYVKGLEGKLEQALARIDQLSQNTEKYGQFYETELQKQARDSSLQAAMGMVQTLLDTPGVAGLYDKRHGPITPFLERFFKDPSGNYPQIQSVIELMRIANEHKLDSLELAFPIWQWKNRGKAAVAAAASAPAPEAKPTAGLSDRQEGSGGRIPTGPTAQDVLDWADGKKPIPPEFKKGGRFNYQAIPAEVRAEVERRRGRK